jgi:uncharacterized membrane protein
MRGGIKISKDSEYGDLWKLALPLNILLFIILLINFLAPLLESKMVAESYHFYSFLRNLCHQLPSRCIWIFGSNMGLCSRCFGIYSGLFLIGVIFSIKKIMKINWKIAALLIIPMLADSITQALGIKLSNNLLRFVSGSLAGIGVGIVIFPAYFKFGLFLLNKRKGRLDRSLKSYL